MRKIILLVVIIVCSGKAFGQINEIIFQVIDQKTNTPVSYATVILKENQRGTHADFDGFFKIPLKYYEKGEIKISAIGFNSKLIALSTSDKKGVNKIYLEESTYNLNEILIVSAEKKRKLRATEIIKNAISNVLENYPTQPYSYVGYYRDYQQAVDSVYKVTKNFTKNINYINLNEAIVEVFDAGFTTSKFNTDNNQALLYEYKNNSDFPQDKELQVPYDLGRKKYAEDLVITPFGGNELNILHITNAIRNHDTNSFSFVEVFDKNFIENHIFKTEGIKYLDDVSLYEISFITNSEKIGIKYKASGKIYISKQDFSIYKLEYNTFLRSKKTPHYSVNIEYLPKGDKMFLNYMMFNNSFSIKGNDFFKLTRANFNYDNVFFKLFFNRPILQSSVNRISQNIVITFKGKKLKITGLSFDEKDDSIMIIKMREKQLTKLGIFENKNDGFLTENININLKKFSDIKGNEINVQPVYKFNQFRELFVQKVFETKNLPLEVNFIDKNSPLSKAVINKTELKENYWINSPLKKVERQEK